MMAMTPGCCLAPGMLSCTRGVLLILKKCQPTLKVILLEKFKVYHEVQIINLKKQFKVYNKLFLEQENSQFKVYNENG